jgi:hypothetical protein
VIEVIVSLVFKYSSRSAGPYFFLSPTMHLSLSIRVVWFLFRTWRIVQDCVSRPKSFRGANARHCSVEKFSFAMYFFMS